MMLTPIEFPTKPQSRLMKCVCAIARFERHHPMACMIIAWVLLAIMLIISAVVPA